LLSSNLANSAADTARRANGGLPLKSVTQYFSVDFAAESSAAIAVPTHVAVSATANAAVAALNRFIASLLGLE
jgi:hypothetical protein